MTPFMFATGIENSYPTILGPDGKNFRRDEMESCGHTTRWEEDFHLVKDLGIEYLRYGPPYYKTHLGPGKYDWDFADETFNALNTLGITPIADLCHFGIPDWLGGSYQNGEWPQHFADYARAFAARFPWVRLYTPVNEIFISACFSGLLGWWNERQTTDKAFVTALKNAAKASILAMKAICDVHPDPSFIQSESSEFFHVAEPGAEDEAWFLNERRFLSLDLTYGYPVRAEMYEYLTDNGMTRDEYHWFRNANVKARCIMGNDYYVTNEHLVHDGGRVDPSGEIFGYYVITKQYYDRYRLPVMHTETNVQDAAAGPGWLWKEWANMRQLKRDGVPILGFTWYSLTDQKDWDVALRENNGRVNPVGLYDLDRKIRPVGTAYKKLIKQWRDVLPTESMGIAAVY